MEGAVSAPATSRVVELSAGERVIIRSILSNRWDELDKERMTAPPNSEHQDDLLRRQLFIEGILRKLR